MNQQIRLETSPADSLADSFVSTPGTMYPPYDNSMDGMMTPIDDDMDLFDQIDGSISGTPAPEKTPVKKRKSWGQQLPEPKTNLPPRKRAKTDDEKEQRRVERVLRNRRAAQASRERKRQEVEALETEKQSIERRTQDLEMLLAAKEARILELENRLASITGTKPTFDNPSPAEILPTTYRQTTPITFSKELFSSQDAHYNTLQSIPQSNPASSPTVNPASLSPEIRPITEFTANASSSDMTQHPAAMLCENPDLQCQSEEQRPWLDTNRVTLTLIILMMVSTTSTFLSPLSQILNSLTTGSPFSATTSILTTIIWLVTTPTMLRTSTSTNSSTTMTSRKMRNPNFSLRMNMLRRLLTCSPHLARPLMDATAGILRLASEQQLFSHACLSGGAFALGPTSRADMPSMEGLITLLWTVQVFDRERREQLRALALMREPGDIVTGKIQACEELDELFRPGSVSVSVTCEREGFGKPAPDLVENKS